jgi:hypothetical protein
MSDDQSASGATDQSSGDGQDEKGEASGQSQVSYDTYKKTISEVKKLKAALKEREDALQKAQQEKLEAEGNKDELITQLKGKLSEVEKKHKETFNSFVYSSLDAQVREEAAKIGCIDPDAVVKLADLSSVEVDAKTFRADKTQLVEVLETLRKEKPYLFGKSGPKLNTKTPGGAPPEEKKKAFKDMSQQELWQELKRVKERQQ